MKIYDLLLTFPLPKRSKRVGMRGRKLQDAGAGAFKNARREFGNASSFEFEQMHMIYELLLTFCFENALLYDVPKEVREVALSLRVLCKPSKLCFDAVVAGLSAPDLGDSDSTKPCFSGLTQRMSWCFSSCVFCGDVALCRRAVGCVSENTDVVVLTCAKTSCRPSFLLRVGDGMCVFTHRSLGFCCFPYFRPLLYLGITVSRTTVLPVSRQIWKCVSSRNGLPIKNTEIDLVVHSPGAGQISHRLNLPTDQLVSIFGQIAGRNVSSTSISWPKLFETMANYRCERGKLVEDLIKLGKRIKTTTESPQTVRGRRKLQVALRLPKKECKHDFQNILTLMKCSNCSPQAIRTLKKAHSESLSTN
jgi:hypothetical protein